MPQDHATSGSPAGYAGISKWLHWLIAACVLAVIPMGIVMLRLPGGAWQNLLFDLHRSTGVLVFALAVLRVAARWRFGTPAPHPGLTRFEHVASTAAQHALLGLILLMPLLGYASSVTFGAPVSVYGMFTLPMLLPKHAALNAVFSWLHTTLGFAMAGIVTLHIAGALRHGFVRRDGVLNRMLPACLARMLDQATGRASRST